VRRFVSKRSLIKQAPGAQISIVVGLGFDADGLHRRFQPELAQHDRGVAGNLDAGADLVQPFCLFEHKHLDPLMTQRNCRRQSTNATTCYEHSHSSSPPLDNLSDFA
jgi:hypothetical protein